MNRVSTTRCLMLVVVIVLLGIATVASAQEFKAALQFDGNRLSDIPYEVVGNVMVIWLIYHDRQITVFVEPQVFTVENIKSIALDISKAYPADDHLTIEIVSNEEELVGKLRWFDYVQSFSFGNVLPPTGTSTMGLEKPLFARYFRSSVSEDLHYLSSDGTTIVIEFKHFPSDGALSGDFNEDLVNSTILGRRETVKQLLALGVDPNIKSKLGGPALVEAAFWGPDSPETVEMLINAGAKVNQTSASGWTALMAAVFRNKAETTELLLSRGAEINLRSEDGRTALILAVKQGNTYAVERLLALGADPTVRDGYGKTALGLAEELKRENLVHLLRGCVKSPGF